MSRSSLIFITLISCLLCSMFLTPVNTYAEGPTVQVEVMEKIPGAGCVDSKVTPKGYTCTI